MERIEPALARITNINNITVKSFRHFHIFFFRVTNEYFCIIRRQVRHKRFCRKGFSGTGLADDNHVAVNTDIVTFEEIDEYWIGITSKTNTFVVLQHVAYKRKRSRNRSCWYSAYLVHKWLYLGNVCGEESIDLFTCEVAELVTALSQFRFKFFAVFPFDGEMNRAIKHSLVTLFKRHK
jgi:hypothetical protein